MVDVEVKGWKVGVEVYKVGDGGGSTQEVRESVENGDLVFWVILWPFHTQRWPIINFGSQCFKLEMSNHL